MMLRAAIIPPDEVLEELRRFGGARGFGTTHDQWDLQLAGLGNVSEVDARRLERALTRELAVLPAPVMFFTTPQVEEGELIAPLGGQVDEMAALARTVHRLAASVNLYVDRRRFRPVLAMASVDGGAAARPAAPAWSGMPWEAGGISLVRTRWTEHGSRAEELAFVELGHPLDHAAAPV